MLTKITNAELKERGATTLPNQPKISATALKQEFDAPAKEIVAPAFNRLIDELEAETAAASLGMVAPTGRTGTTVQEVVENIALDLSYLEGSVLAPVIEQAHTHENKELLDTYTQDDEDIADAISKAHSHENKAVIDKFGENSQGKPTYDGNPIGGGSGSGDMSEADYDPEGNVKTAGGIEDYVEGAISGKADSADLATVATSGSYNDLDDTPTIPDVSGKADKVSNATSGNFAGLDNSGNLTDSGNKASDFLTSHQDISGKADKVSGATNGNFAGLDSDGNLTDSGSKANDFLTSVDLTSDVTGVLPITNGGTGNSAGYIRTGKKSGTTIGDRATAEGINTTASGLFSHAEGSGTTASGSRSHAEGYRTIAGYANQHVCGEYNDNKSTTLLEVGNGADENNLSNAFEVYENGDINCTGEILKNGEKALDDWTAEVTVSSSQAVFDNLDDSLGYKLVAEDTLVGITAISKTTGTETGTVKMTYTLVGATNGTTKCKLRILR